MRMYKFLQLGALLAGAYITGCASQGGGTGMTAGGANGAGGNVNNAGGTNASNTSPSGTAAGGANSGTTGGTKASAAQGGNSPTSGGVAGVTGGANSNNPTGGSNNGTTGGSKAAGGSGNTPTGGSGNTPTGGAQTAGGTASSAGAASGGSTAVTCSNTDMSIIPIDKSGWVDKACDACGIQGAFYWYADANTTASLQCNGAACVQNVPPYQSASPGPGMCISGTATGSSKDWGAGIGLSLNDSGGDAGVKSGFNANTAACGKITGFDIALSGNTNGMPIRVGFTGSGTSCAAPFIPVGDPAGSTLQLSGSTQIVIANATIPSDWTLTAGCSSTVDPTSIYDLQIQVATDQAKANTAFNVCVDSIKPTINGGGAGGSSSTGDCKANTVGTIGTNTGVQALGSSYGYQNNVNNLGSGSESVKGYYGSSCVAMDVNTSGITSSNTSPASYPSIVEGWAWGGSWSGSYTQTGAKKLSALSAVTSSWSFTPPAGSKWDVSYDMWLAQSTGTLQPDANTLEVMVWLDYSNSSTTNPIGSNLNSPFTAAGTTWEVWYGSAGSWHTVTYRRSPGTAPVSSFDLLQFLKDAVKYGTGATSWYLLSVQAGFELFNATSGGSIDSYSVSIN